MGSSNYNKNVSDVIDNAYSRGIAVVAAVGDKKKNSVMFPASHEKVLSIAACDEKGKIYKESNNGEKVDAYMPGVDIVLPAINAAGERIKVTKSGSSLASAMMSVSLALYLSTHNSNSIKEVYNSFKRVSDVDLFALI